MQNNYHLYDVALIYLAGLSKHNFIFLLFVLINNVTLYVFSFCMIFFPLFHTNMFRILFYIILI
jgi:hypothetical protein